MMEPTLAEMGNHLSDAMQILESGKLWDFTFHITIFVEIAFKMPALSYLYVDGMSIV